MGNQSTNEEIKKKGADAVRKTFAAPWQFIYLLPLLASFSVNIPEGIVLY